jgi:mRNA interferase HigB
MVVISKSILNQYCESHADACEALQTWFQIVKQADWARFQDIKNMFGATDYVGDDRYVFNIRGNRYRLVALVFFSVRTVYIKFIGTHAEYDKINVLTIDLKQL